MIAIQLLPVSYAGHNFIHEINKQTGCVNYNDCLFQFMSDNAYRMKFPEEEKSPYESRRLLSQHFLANISDRISTVQSVYFHNLRRIVTCIAKIVRELNQVRQYDL